MKFLSIFLITESKGELESVVNSLMAVELL